jgi:3-oxoadipate enol-lactonase
MRVSGADAVDRYLAVPADGVRLRYRDEGHGPAVLFVHGWTLDLDMWDPQIAALRDRFRCVRFDRRGFGLSDGIPSLERDVEDALTVCRALCVERFACVGMSQGARIALYLAMHEPGTLESMVLDGPPYLFDESGICAQHDSRPSTWRSVQDFRMQWRHHPLMQLVAAAPDNRLLLERMIERYPGRDLADDTRQDSLTFTTDALRAIRIPTLVLGGEYDLPSRLAAANELTRALPRATRAVVSGAGHLPNLDNPQAYNILLGDFLGRRPARKEV